MVWSTLCLVENLAEQNGTLPVEAQALGLG